MLWRRRTAPPDVEADGFDMTPLIDCTFQLILFFMLVTDLARVQTDPVRLPAAARATDLKTDPPLIVNVTSDGRCRISGKTMDDGALEALFDARRPRRPGQDTPVLIRADRSTSFEHVQKVMTIAGAHGQVTRIQFSARKE